MVVVLGKNDALLQMAYCIVIKMTEYIFDLRCNSNLQDRKIEIDKT